MTKSDRSLHSARKLHNIRHFTVAGHFFALQSLSSFDDNGAKDLLLQHTHGSLEVILMMGTNLASTNLLDNGSMIDPSWTVCVADFNNDGNPDPLWQSSDGHLLAWLGEVFESNQPDWWRHVAGWKGD